MLDDNTILKQRDALRPLLLLESAHTQLTNPLTISNPDFIASPITQVIFAGMGGSALAADILLPILKSQYPIQFSVVKQYELPASIDEKTLVIAISYSGNTEETLACIEQAQANNTQLALISSGGKIKEIAETATACYVKLPSGMQPRMTTLYQLRAIGMLLDHFNITQESIAQSLEEQSEWLRVISEDWSHDTPTEHNKAKQIALHAVGKVGMFYGSPLTAPLAYKWKISWNENAKNIAFCSTYPEFNHNEFIGWTSHPIEKPFAVFDIHSHLDHPRVALRMQLSNQLLSGRRPQAQTLDLQGETYLQQAIASCVLADFTSIYLAVLNGINPEPVALIEALKERLADA